jgi:rfaE bifunctional protein nucleotidyltransferase chain/domain
MSASGSHRRPGVTTMEDAAAFARRLRAAGRRVVFTNGVFDLLHPGHVRYLRAARAEGDALVVAVNSDRSVQANKGPDRPLVPDHERAEILAALDAVDAVFVFDEPTPARAVEAIAPHVLVKGADWPGDRIVGRETVEAGGGHVVRARIEPGYSTTAILNRIRSARRADRNRARSSERPPGDS